MLSAVLCFVCIADPLEGVVTQSPRPPGPPPIQVFSTDVAKSGYVGSSDLPTANNNRWTAQLGRTNFLSWSVTSQQYADEELVFNYPKTDLSWRYWVVLDTAIAPRMFKTAFELTKSNFAGEDDGFDDVDFQGWPCKRVPLNGVLLRVYRLKNQLHGAFQLRVKVK